jgi:hypothetical protein
MLRCVILTSKDNLSTVPPTCYLSPKLFHSKASSHTRILPPFTTNRSIPSLLHVPEALYTPISRQSWWLFLEKCRECGIYELRCHEYTPHFANIGTGIQTLIVGVGRGHSQTYTQHGDLMSLFFFFFWSK